VLWSNALAYHDVLLAPRPRLAELQRIGDLVAGNAPTLLNAYDIYGNDHFLRAGAPVGPAEYRPVALALDDGTQLTWPAWADLDSFPLSTLEEYPSIVTRRSPAESRPPSNYRLAWRGRYYDLWQRSEDPGTKIVDHIPLGESNELPYCGNASNGPYKPECSVDPVTRPPCARIEAIARRAAGLNANLVAYQRAAPIVARGDQTRWPAPWLQLPEEHVLMARSPGEATAEIAVSESRRYELWIGGNFARGFEVGVDGRDVGTIENEISASNGYVHLADLLLPAGTHTFTLTYPDPDLTPGSGDNSFTSLSAIALQPQAPASELLTVAPSQARRLCGRPLDWIEIVEKPG
jgi:hypothetical protein